MCCTLSISKLLPQEPALTRAFFLPLEERLLSNALYIIYFKTTALGASPHQGFLPASGGGAGGEAAP